MKTAIIKKRDGSPVLIDGEEFIAGLDDFKPSEEVSGVLTEGEKYILVAAEESGGYYYESLFSLKVIFKDGVFIKDPDEDNSNIVNFVGFI